MKNKILVCVFVAVLAVIYAPLVLAGSATVSWNANSESDLAGYKVYYGSSPRTGTDPKVCGLCGYATSVNVGNITSYNFSSLTGGQTYYFSVTAYDTSNNESAFSSEVSKQIITLPVISNLVGSNTTATTTQISWNTNVNTNGQVFYGITSAYGSQSALLDNNVKTTSHSTVLSSLTPSTLYHFKVTSVDASGNSASSQDFTFTTLAPLPPPAPTISNFTANPLAITQGQTTTLSWTISGSVTALTLDNRIGSVLGVSSKSVSPLSQTTYTLTATGPGGTASSQVTVNVSNPIVAPTSTPPTISSFTVSPSSIIQGQSTTLSWAVTGNPTPTVSIDNYLGVQSNTSVIINPSQTTSYTLTSSNSAGMATAQVTVNVTAPSPVTSGGGGGGGSGTVSSGGSSPVTVYIPINSGGTGVTTTTMGSATTSADYLQNEIALLTSQLNSLLAELNGKTVKTYNFSRNLSVGSVGADVKTLQQFLNTNGFVINKTGNGSPGNESTFFGTLTSKALIKFQSSVGLPATGFFGALTRGKVNGK